MPGIFYQPINRRRFLAVSSKAVASLAVVRTMVTMAADATSQKAVHLALLSDTHFPSDPQFQNRKFFPVENFKLVLSQVAEARPQGVILNGDLARSAGELEEYVAIKNALNPLAEQTPIYMALGNHDNRENFLKIFEEPSGARQKVAGKHVLVVEHSVIRFILLDSMLYPNKVPGFLGKAQRDWLAGFLGNSDSRPTVIFVHHTLGETDNDLLDAERLYQIVGLHKKVKAIFYGHSHEYSYKKRDGLHLINIPAIGYNFADKEPVGWLDSQFTAEGAELTLRAFGGNRADDGKTTSLIWVG